MNKPLPKPTMIKIAVKKNIYTYKYNLFKKKIRNQKKLNKITHFYLILNKENIYVIHVQNLILDKNYNNKYFNIIIF